MRELHPLAYTKKGKKSCICYTWMEQINSDVKTYQRSKVRGKIKVKYRRRQKNRKKSIWKTPSQSVICILIGILPAISYLLLHNHLFTFSLPLMLFFRANSSAWRQKWTFKCWKCVFCSCFMRWIWMHFDR